MATHGMMLPKQLLKEETQMNKMDNKWFELGATQPLILLRNMRRRHIQTNRSDRDSWRRVSLKATTKRACTPICTKYSWPLLGRIIGTLWLFSRREMTARVYAKAGVQTILAMESSVYHCAGQRVVCLRTSVKASRTLTQNVRRITSIFLNMGKIVCKLKTIEPNAYFCRYSATSGEARDKIFFMSQANLPKCAICLTYDTCRI